MAIARHQPVAPRSDASKARQAHSPSNETVERVALQAHEFSESLSASEELTVIAEVNLFAGQFSGEAELSEICPLPGHDTQWCK